MFECFLCGPLPTDSPTSTSPWPGGWKPPPDVEWCHEQSKPIDVFGANHTVTHLSKRHLKLPPEGVFNPFCKTIRFHVVFDCSQYKRATKLQSGWVTILNEASVQSEYFPSHLNAKFFVILDFQWIQWIFLIYNSFLHSCLFNTLSSFVIVLDVWFVSAATRFRHSKLSQLKNKWKCLSAFPQMAQSYSLWGRGVWFQIENKYKLSVTGQEIVSFFWFP